MSSFEIAQGVFSVRAHIPAYLTGTTDERISQSILGTLLTDTVVSSSIVNPRKLEHGFRMINAGIPYTLL